MSAELEAVMLKATMLKSPKVNVVVVVVYAAVVELT